MIVYNIPLAGMMTVDMIERLASLPNVKGVKYTGTALYEVTQIRDACKPGFQIYGAYVNVFEYQTKRRAFTRRTENTSISTISSAATRRSESRI